MSVDVFASTDKLEKTVVSLHICKYVQSQCMDVGVKLEMLRIHSTEGKTKY